MVLFDSTCSTGLRETQSAVSPSTLHWNQMFLVREKQRCLWLKTVSPRNEGVSMQKNVLVPAGDL